MRHERGSQNDKMSGCWFVSRFEKANPRSAITTETTMSAGPASAAASLRARDGGASSEAVAGAVSLPGTVFMERSG
jgi:hypothetical protein